MAVHQTYTDHMIDDMQLCKEEAFNAFMKQFPLKQTCTLDNAIQFTLKHHRNAESWLRKAQQIIKGMGLPLEAEIISWSRQDIVFEKQIEITYSL